MGNHSKQFVEIQVNVSGNTLNVSEMSEDIYKSIDIAINKLERKLRKYKTRIKGFKHEKVTDYAYDDGYAFEEE